jgi:arylsulfatase
MIQNLRMDPYERGFDEGGANIDFIARQMWLIIPIQGVIKDFFSDFDKYPYQEGSSLNAAGINYGMLRQQDALKRLKDVERMTRPNN